MIVNIEKWICQSCQMYLSRLQNYLFDPRIRTVLQRWGNAFQGAPCHDGEDPWTFPWLVSLLPDDILNLFTNFLPRQNVSTNEDKILPSGQACLGRAQLRRQICERKLQIAQGSSTTMIIPVSSLMFLVAEVPAIWPRGARAAVWFDPSHAHLRSRWEDRPWPGSEVSARFFPQNFLSNAFFLISNTRKFKTQTILSTSTL